MAYIEQKNRLAPTWEQAFKNCIEFMSNLLGLSWLELGDVELYIQNVDLFMLIHWTHNSEKGVSFLLYIYASHKNSIKSGTSFSQSASQCPPPTWLYNVSVAFSFQNLSATSMWNL